MKIKSQKNQTHKRHILIGNTLRNSLLDTQSQCGWFICLGAYAEQSWNVSGSRKVFRVMNKTRMSAFLKTVSVDSYRKTLFRYYHDYCYKYCVTGFVGCWWKYVNVIGYYNSIFFLLLFLHGIQDGSYIMDHISAH